MEEVSRLSVIGALKDRKLPTVNSSSIFWALFESVSQK
jgi:hypothetical protein